MLRRLSILLPLVILALALGLRYADPWPVERFRLAVFDEYQRLKPRAWQDTPVRIIDIDDESLARLGQWPWPRTVFATLLDRLGDLGAAVVAFDVLFAEPDRTSPREIARLWKEAAGQTDLMTMMAALPDHDRMLAKVAGEVPTILAMQLTEGRVQRRPAHKRGMAVGGDPEQFLSYLPVFNGAVVPLAELEAAAMGQGSINSQTDRDGIIRRVALFFRLKGDGTVADEVYPSLAVEALRVAQGPAASYIAKVSGASGELSFGEKTGIAQVKIGEMVVPTDHNGAIWLYDTGFKKERFIPAWEVFGRSFDRERVDGRIVFIGASAAALKDQRATPLNEIAAGVEVHAQALEQILTETYLARPDWMTGAELLWLLLFGGALSVLLPRWGAAWCAVVAGTGVVATLAVSWLAFDHLAWLTDPVYPSLTVVVLYLALSFVMYLRTENERRQVRSAFGLYLSPSVVEQVARDPAKLRLGGEIRPMTIMFCDIRGFTTISESLDAGGLTRLINGFLTPMTEIIQAHGGTIDKYIGDAIMAFWNAPLDDPDHAANAARAVLAMTRRLQPLNDGWQAEAVAAGRPYRPITIGVGLNTGSCCVGNMGSEQRLAYSVLGDAVNLASRLEGQSKTYGVPIVAGESLALEAPEMAWLELDLVRVKGKDKTVRVFALLGDETAAREPWFRLAAMAQGEMLAAYRTGDWEKAGQALERVRQAGAGLLDGVCDLYQWRLMEFAGAPPPSGWTGVYAPAEK
jgi:adenylate cyclase